MFQYEVSNGCLFFFVGGKKFQMSRYPVQNAAEKVEGICQDAMDQSREHSSLFPAGIAIPRLSWRMMAWSMTYASRIDENIRVEKTLPLELEPIGCLLCGSPYTVIKVSSMSTRVEFHLCSKCHTELTERSVENITDEQYAALKEENS